MVKLRKNCQMFKNCSDIICEKKKLTNKNLALDSYGLEFNFN